MKINNTPVRTSKNYGINNFEIPDAELAFKPTSPVKIEQENTLNLKISQTKNIVFEKPISTKLENQLEFANHSLVAKIEKSQDSPIVLNFSNYESLVSKIFIESAENVDAKIILTISNNKKSYSNIFAKFEIGKGSNVSVVFVCDTIKECTNLFNVEAVLNENSQTDIRFMDFGSNYSILNFYSKLVGDNSICNFKNLYLGNQTNKFDINILQDIFGKNCAVNNTTVGALFESSQKNYKGTINFNKGSKKSIGDESELCLLLSKTAKSKALPMLLCTEEDVDGSHSTAVGKLDDKELFYVMSRGLNKTEALMLMLKAKFNAVLNGLFDEQLLSEIIEKIDRKMNNEN